MRSRHNSIYLFDKSSVRKNIIWLISDKILKLLFGTLINILVARFLGPEVFGILSYGLAIYILMSTFGQFGSKDYLIQKLTLEPDKINKNLITIAVLMILTSIIAFIITLFYIVYLSNLPFINKLTITIILSAVLTQFLMIGSFLNEARLNSSKNVRINFIIMVLFGLIKLIAIYLGFGILGFSTIYLMENIFTMLLYFLSVKLRYDIRWILENFDRKVFFTTIAECWPLCFSALSVVAYMKIDQIMIGELLSSRDLGVYSAAVKISEFFYIFGAAIVASVFPRLIQKSQTDPQKQQHELLSLSKILTLIAIIFTAFVFMFSDFIVHVTFGKEFDDAANSLKVHMFACVFVYQGAIGSRWYLLNGLGNLLLIRSVSALCLNVILNYLLLEKYGIVVAAYTTLASYILSSLLFDAVDRRTRSLFFLKLNGFNIIETITRLRSYLSAIF